MIKLVSRLLMVLATLLALSAPAMAKPKKRAPATTESKPAKPTPPGDKGQNDGAQGRKNATEDAARAADSPQFEHRP